MAAILYKGDSDPTRWGRDNAVIGLLVAVISLR
jgi:hypothetical protein